MNRNPLLLHRPKDNVWEELTVSVMGRRTPNLYAVSLHNKDTELKRTFFISKGSYSSRSASVHTRSANTRTGALLLYTYSLLCLAPGCSQSEITLAGSLVKAAASGSQTERNYRRAAAAGRGSTRRLQELWLGGTMCCV